MLAEVTVAGAASPVDRHAPSPALSGVLSAILCPRSAAPDLAALMRALVPAAVDGLVREVIVADPTPDAEIEKLCEGAGAVLVRGGLAEAAGRARAEAVLAIPPGLELPDPWMRRLGEALNRGARAGLVLGEGKGGLLGAFSPRPCAVLAPRAEAAASADFAALKRRLGGGIHRIG